MNYWLMKSEPDAYSIDDLINDTTTPWDGIRNYQARNFMRDKMQIGDYVLFYHSNCKPPGIVGIAEVCKLTYPDHTAWDPSSKYFDPKSSPDKPIWEMVSPFIQKFKEKLSLDQIKAIPELANMLVVKRGMRLSIQPVEKQDFEFITNKLNS